MKTIIHQWKQSLALTEQTMTLPNGHTLTHTTIEHPGAAVIIPVTEDGRIVVVNQYRPSLGKWMIEVPAGTMELGEEPLECAKRELEEETGYSAERFISLGQLTPMAGMCDEIQHLFVAYHLDHTQRYACDADEIIEVTTHTLEQLEQFIIEGKITDSKTIACLYKAKLCHALQSDLGRE
ncbi:NUDIX hydrolase [Vibrio palustris]|uniref:GDP-mannose pyrophosphatase n=1 Tax=Vibrio palustris TaxID=1918946 RepID=A0A1R4B6W1_9VIBR|nr:NUDIX hydrolase [Vibrio palustris]SJL84650.1 ADP-ribose pyrophosphatase [Vibrio palustris]